MTNLEQSVRMDRIRRDREAYHEGVKMVVQAFALGAVFLLVWAMIVIAGMQFSV